MRIFYFVVALFLIAFLDSCKKGGNSDTPTTPPVSYKIKTYTEDVTSASSGNSLDVFNLSYDDQDRLISLISAGDPTNRFEYSYPTASNFLVKIYNQDSLIFEEDVHLNANKLADTTYQYDQVGDTTIQKSTYNEKNLLVKLEEYDRSDGQLELWNTTTYTYDGNDNLSTESDEFGTTTYTYAIVVPNTVVILPPGMFAPKQLPTKEEFESGGTTYTVDHTYKLDELKRIMEDRSVSSDGDIVVKTYTYC